MGGTGAEIPVTPSVNWSVITLPRGPRVVGGIDLDRLQAVCRELAGVDRDREISEGVGPVGRDVGTRDIGGVEPADDLAEGRIARRLVDDRDPGRISEAGNLTQAVDQGLDVVTSVVPSGAVPETLLGSSAVVLGNTIGAMLMANAPWPKVVASKRSGSGVEVGSVGCTDRPDWACRYWGRCCPAIGSSW